MTKPLVEHTRIRSAIFIGETGGENVIRPDREIIPSWDDYKAGRDAVLEWVLRYGHERGGQRFRVWENMR